MKNSVWKTFMELSLVRGIVPRTVFGLTAIAAIILVIGLALSKSNKRGRLHPLIVSLIAAVLAGAAGMLVAWLVSDVFMVFGRIAGLAGDLHHRGRHRRRRLRDRRSRDHARSPPCAGHRAGAAGAAVHRARRGLDLRRIPDHRHPRRYTPYASLGSIEVHKAAMSVSDWRSKAQKGSLPSMPSQGKVLTVDIPNAKSNFTARKAMIYCRPPRCPTVRRLASDGAVGRAAR